MRDAQPLLDEIGLIWRDENDIIKSISQKFDCAFTEVREDWYAIRKELIDQGFVDCKYEREDSAAEELLEKGRDGIGITNPETDTGYTPLGDFCIRNEIPSEFHLDLTDSCTERCIHCYVPKEQHHFLPYKLAEKAIWEFRELQGLSVHITGGECMLHPDFERICELCKSLNINIIILSNLTCCDTRRIAFLRKIDPQFINVSLYSMNSEEHDAITQLPGSWKKTMDTLLACEKAGVHCRS